MYTFKVGDIVRLKTIEEEPRNTDLFILTASDRTRLREAKTLTVKREHTTDGIQKLEFYEVSGTSSWYAWRFELVKRPRKRTPPIKRKGYALWIHNIECERKKGRKHAN
jgi:hypothetical protein